ncbi:MAG: hypothetical protein K2X27_18385 [Candidatus Obscuribacterales bacterium]|nr:hypothetical protein [Candidatus Obscuribacterales bacterium]
MVDQRIENDKVANKMEATDSVQKTRERLYSQYQEHVAERPRGANCMRPVNNVGNSQDSLDLPPLKEFSKENHHLPKGKEDFGAFLIQKNKERVDKNRDGVFQLDEIKAFAADSSLGKLSRDSVSTVAKNFEKIKGYVNDAAGVGLSAGDLSQAIAGGRVTGGNDCPPSVTPGTTEQPPVTQDVPPPSTELHLGREYDGLKILKDNFETIDADKDGYLRGKEVRQWLRDPFREVRLQGREKDGIEQALKDNLPRQNNDQTGKEVGFSETDIEIKMKKFENRAEKRATGLR